jgi:hypothetical protein
MAPLQLGEFHDSHSKSRWQSQPFDFLREVLFAEFVAGQEMPIPQPIPYGDTLAVQGARA